MAEPVYYNGFRAGTDVVGPSDPADAGAIGRTLGVAAPVGWREGVARLTAWLAAERGFDLPHPARAQVPAEALP